MLIPRAAEEAVRQLAEGYPVLVITGPRQSGKTTLVQAMFGDRPYVSLEDLDERAQANDDPRRFLGRFPEGAVLDEVQRAPDLFSYLYFWRDRSGHEVDLLVDRGTELVPIEAKSGQTVNSSFFTGLRKWQEIAGDAAGSAWLVYGGDRRHGRENIEALPWREIEQLAKSVV